MRDHREPTIPCAQVRAELLADTSRGPVATDVDDLGALIVAELARGRVNPP